MKPGLMSFRDVDWTAVDRVENPCFRTNTVIVMFNSGRRFEVKVPRELFIAIWSGGEQHVMDQDAKKHDDSILNDGELH